MYKFILTLALLIGTNALANQSLVCQEKGQYEVRSYHPDNSIVIEFTNLPHAEASYFSQYDGQKFTHESSLRSLTVEKTDLENGTEYKLKGEKISGTVHFLKGRSESERGEIHFTRNGYATAQTFRCEVKDVTIDSFNRPDAGEFEVR